jgi:hypothetical protein
VLDSEMTRLLRVLESRLNDAGARTADERRSHVRAVFQHPFAPDLITPLEEWLANDEPVPVYVAEHRGIFGRDVDFDDLRLAWWVELAPTIYLDRVLMGADKPGHFLGQGFQYFVEHGSLPEDWSMEQKLEHMRRFGYATEIGNLGVATGGVFSYADLSSNWAGFLFHLCLFDDIDVAGERHARFFTIDAKGRTRLTRPFHWSEWVTADWDEVQNPNAVAGRRLYAKIAGALRARPKRGPSVCESYRRSPEAFLGSSERLLDRQRYVTVPAREPFRFYSIRLEAICAP